MSKRKIVIIGAGSASFGPTTLATIVRNEALRGSDLALVDLDETAVTHAAQVAERMSDAWGAEMSVSATTDRLLLQDMGTSERSSQIIFTSSANNLQTMLQIVTQRLLQRQHTRLVVDQSQQ